MDKHTLENEIPKGEAEDIGNNLDDFEILQTLGKGNYGFVSKVKSRKNQKIYAMKMIDLSLVNDPQEIQLLINEIKIIQNLSSPHIVKCYHSFKIDQKVYILMEFINNGDIKGYIQANSSMQKTIPEQEIWELMYQSMSGLYYIHQNNLIHRDIKPANLFLTENKTVKIGDFGVSAERKIGNNFQHKAEKETIMIGTPLYMSPEIFGHQPYGSKVDIYSLGCTFYELCFFSAPRLPVPGVNQNGEIFTDLKDIPPRYNQNVYSQDLITLINMMIEKDQNKRPSSDIVFSKIKEKYNSFKMQSTSIFCVYRSLLSFQNFYNKLTKHKPTQNEGLQNIPLTCTFDLALNQMTVPNTTSFPIINQIRDILTFNNSNFNDPGEIDCIDLVDYIITRLFMETNHNKECKSPYLYTEESDPDTYNRGGLLQKYLLNLQNFFKSYVSNLFFGHFEVNRKCLQCNQVRTFFENFYYLTININAASRNGINPNNPNFIYYCLQNISKLNVNKMCPNCNAVTLQEETKEIFSKPINIIIYIKNDNPNILNNIKYPIKLKLNSKFQNGGNGNTNDNIEIYDLMAVIQQNVQNGQTTYGCAFPFNQNWYFGNGYNLMNCDNSPLKFNYGNVVMLFYTHI